MPIEDNHEQSYFRWSCKPVKENQKIINKRF